MQVIGTQVNHLARRLLLTKNIDNLHRQCTAIKVHNHGYFTSTQQNVCTFHLSIQNQKSPVHSPTIFHKNISDTNAGRLYKDGSPTNSSISPHLTFDFNCDFALAISTAQHFNAYFVKLSYFNYLLSSQNNTIKTSAVNERSIDLKSQWIVYDSLTVEMLPSFKLKFCKGLN